ncbi:14453_t:CDS:1, partial [Cetraspora pellucida]
QPEISLKKDPLVWWDLHSKKFPVLSKLARIYLAVPATFNPSERLFSDAGNLMTSKRTHISPELFKRMLFLKRNIDQYQNIHPE